MLNLTKLRDRVEEQEHREQYKTYLNRVARRKIALAAKVAGVPRYRIIEELVEEFLPEVAPRDRTADNGKRK